MKAIEITKWRYYSMSPKTQYSIDEQGHQSCAKLLLWRCLYYIFQICVFVGDTNTNYAKSGENDQISKMSLCDMANEWLTFKYYYKYI